MNRKKQVLLINPPSPPGTTANREGVGGLGTSYPSPGAFLYPAHTLASVASVLRRLGHGAMAMDMVAWEGTPSLATKVIETGRWHAILLLVSHVTLEHDLSIARLLRQLPGCPPLTLVGPSTQFMETARDEIPADVVIQGEPEKVLLKDADCIFTRPSGDAPIFAGNGLDGFVEDLDSLPFPAWDLVPSGKGGFLTVFGSKGCSRHCAYCPYVVAQGRNVRARSLESVLEEIQWLADSFNVHRVMFRDIAFAADSGRVEAFCQALIKKRLALRWECESHPVDFQPGLLDLMKKAGCVEIKIGLETAHPDLLQDWHRVESLQEAGEYLSHVARLLDACGRKGIRCHLFLMVGAPGQKKASTESTLGFLQHVHPRLLNVKHFHPYPGIALASTPAGTEPEDTFACIQLLQGCQTAGHTNGGSLHRFFRLHSSVPGRS